MPWQTMQLSDLVCSEMRSPRGQRRLQIDRQRHECRRRRTQRNGENAAGQKHAPQNRRRVFVMGEAGHQIRMRQHAGPAIRVELHFGERCIGRQINTVKLRQSAIHNTRCRSTAVGGNRICRTRPRRRETSPATCANRRSLPGRSRGTLSESLARSRGWSALAHDEQKRVDFGFRPAGRPASARPASPTALRSTACPPRPLATTLDRASNPTGRTTIARRLCSHFCNRPAARVRDKETRGDVSERNTTRFTAISASLATANCRSTTDFSSSAESGRRNAAAANLRENFFSFSARSEASIVGFRQIVQMHRHIVCHFDGGVGGRFFPFLRDRRAAFPAVAAIVGREGGRGNECVGRPGGRKISRWNRLFHAHRPLPAQLDRRFGRWQLLLLFLLLVVDPLRGLGKFES